MNKNLYKQFPRKKKHFIKRNAGRARFKKDGSFKPSKQ